MKTNRLLLGGAILAALTACSGGGIDLNVSTVDNSISQGGGGGGGTSGANPCASYQVAGGTDVRRGSYDGRNCTYTSQFVGFDNPLTVALSIPVLPNSGVHIFQDTLAVGRNVTTGAAPASGTGPALTIAAGAILAFADSDDYVLVNRGSRIQANGTASQPIVFTSVADAVNNTAGANDVSQWGGMVINGNGITNNCTDAQRTGNACHVVSEGRPSNYGGNDNADNSGTLRFVIVKHTGFEVAPNDELNGITFNAVGSGTTVENVQVYSTFDDGFEWFGGAVNARNLVALYVRDDAFDFADGYVGTITNALAIQWRTEGNHCIELDNVGSNRFVAGTVVTPVTRPVVNNMTCIMSTQPLGTHGVSRGAIIRLGGQIELNNSIFFTPYGDAFAATNGTQATNNPCLILESDQTAAGAAAGTTRITNTVFACRETIVGTTPTIGGQTPEAWLRAQGAATVNVRNQLVSLATTPALATLNLLEGAAPAGTGTEGAGTSPATRTFYTRTPIAQITAGSPSAALFTGTGLPSQIGAVTSTLDWTTPWAFGLRAANADQPLWFTQQ